MVNLISVRFQIFMIASNMIYSTTGERIINNYNLYNNRVLDIPSALTLYKTVLNLADIIIPQVSLYTIDHLMIAECRNMELLSKRNWILVASYVNCY